MKIQTNSELPITMLKKYNKNLNSFDFVLFHLYESDKNYREYFLNMRRTNPERLMILDNSAYEFFVKGEKLDLKRYAEVVSDLCPNYYILPDVLMDTKKTCEGVRNFLKGGDGVFLNKWRAQTTTQPIAVVQGNSKEEMQACMTFYIEKGIKNIAIPFHNSFFKDDYDWCDGDIAYAFSSNGYNYFTEDIRYASGRAMWVKENINVLNTFRKIHLLGSHCPAEKAFYESLDIPNLTMDTGYPVKCAIEGFELGTEKSKPNIIIDDFMNEVLPLKTQELIVKNVTKFKNYTNE